MSSETPPTYYFSGIKFNPSFYQSTSGDYLTLATAKSSFLTYPTAQGTETISTLNSSTINSTSASTNMTIGNNVDIADLSIGSLQTSGDLYVGTGARTTAGGIYIGTGSGATVNPIFIGGAASSTTVGGPLVVTGKTTCAQYDSTTATTEMSVGSNLSTANLTLGSGLGTGSIIIGKNNGAHTGEIRIGATQTSGVMNIATGSTRTGNLNICNTSGATNTINLGVNGTPVNIEGSLIKIGATQTSTIMEIATSASRTSNVFFCSTTGQTNNIYIGASGTKSMMDGTVSILQPLTLPVATTSPTTTQLGYFASSNNATEITVSATNSTPATVTNLPIGIYLFSYSVISYTPSIGASQVMTYSITTTGGATSSIANYVFNGVATTFQDTQRLVGVVKATTASNSVVLNLIITSGGGTIKASQNA